MEKTDVLISPDTIPDTDIIRRVLDGEKNLYEMILRRYNQRLYRIAQSILHDEHESEEAMQVAYISAYENLSAFQSRSAFSTWLTRILINECLKRAKKRKQSAMINDDTMDKDTRSRHPVEHQTPVVMLLNTELRTKLEDAIHQLPEKYRTVFVMREIENMNVAETKECLDLSEANVKVRLNRAKVLLRSSLQQYYRSEELFHFHLSRCNRIVQHVMHQIQLNY